MKHPIWLKKHLLEFVKPRISVIPNASFLSLGFNEETTKQLIVNWKQAKKLCGAKTMLLAGRDVWEFEILARLDGFKSEFRSDISTDTVGHITKDYSEYYLIDSGYSGSVPETLGVMKWNLVSGTNQLLPGNYAAASIAGSLEGTPKYWTRARWVKGKPKQAFSAKTTFTRAAALTRAIAEYYLDVS